MAKRASARRGVISPLLANIYMNRFLKYWRQYGLGQRFKAHVVAYADDLVILSRGHAGEAHEVLRDVMTRIGLTLNETKTKLREARSERFDFLGYTFGPFWDRRTGRCYLGAGPSSKSRKRIKAEVHAITTQNARPWPEVFDQLNNTLRGWQGYFGYGTLKRVYSEVDWYVANRVRHFLRRRHKVRSRGSRQFACQHVHGTRKVLRLGHKLSQRGGAPHAFA